MKYLHTMVRVTDLDASMAFYRDALGLTEVRRTEHAAGRFTLVYLAAVGDAAGPYQPQVELTYNWPDAEGKSETYTGGRNFGHLAFAVPDIYAACQRLADHGVAVLRPPRDGRMAFVRSPDNISIELLQDGPALAPAEPWASMPNTGSW
ncbi:VOC family protein [Roseateles koreensis]|uniref:Lactoylglutathione lyase n=1 Tax=Roseateles koreensis TaxID=2987526 RepID=A0ABT5KU95_9BURK|nr:lactoylglutathione lyase [Roseateles koreensis]MDC8786494.1 lactoylglutathione lyase [Roseateles koreensis]